MASTLENADDTTPADVEGLQRALSAADSRAFLVSQRVIRRVIRYSDGLGLLGLSLPSHRAILLEAANARVWIDPSELCAAVPENDGEPIILIPRPHARELARSTAGDLLVTIWRLLFHSRVRLALKAIVANGQLTERAIRLSIERIGRIEFEEIRVVLAREALLDDPRDENAAFIEFAALFLELHRFAPEQIAVYFPSIEAPERIVAILDELNDADAIFQASRPEGAPERPSSRVAIEPGGNLDPSPEAIYEDAIPSLGGRYGRMTRFAERASTAENFVRAGDLADPARPSRSGGFAQAQPGRSGASDSAALRPLARGLRTRQFDHGVLEGGTSPARGFGVAGDLAERGAIALRLAKGRHRPSPRGLRRRRD